MTINASDESVAVARDGESWVRPESGGGAARRHFGGTFETDDGCKIILLILLSTCLCLANSEYPRFKRRGQQQNGPPRPPAPPQFGKKWGKPPQKGPPPKMIPHKMPPQKMSPHFMQNRPYPVPPQQVRGGRPKPPMHLSHGMNIPLSNVGHLQHSANGPKFQQYPYQSKPQIPPKQAHFKHPVQQHKIPNVPVVSGALLQFPQESNHIPKIVHQHQEKPSFVSSPSMSALEYDYHVQSNTIPTNTNPIKQVGEKGPIHTIPAPNLTPADMPSNLEFKKEHHYHQQQEFRFQKPQFISEQPTVHQYQVTEPSDQPPKSMFRDQINVQTHYNQNAPAQSYQTIIPNQPANRQQFDHLLNQQQLEQQIGGQSYQNLQAAFYHPDHPGLTLQDDGNHGINIGFGQMQEDVGGQEDMAFSNSKHYQVVNDQFLSGDTNQNVHTQAIQSSFAQQQPQLMNQYLEEPGYVQQYQHENIQIADDKNVHPNYQSFNYDEQAHQAQAKSGETSYVKATYSLGSDDEIIKGENIHSRSSSVDPLTQAQIVQSYFDTRSQNTIEPDAKPSVTEKNEKENQNSPYYTSLPNKEAAERLAKLQAAGKVNNNLMKLANNRNYSENDKISTIYVPEENNKPDQKEDRIDQDDNDQSLEYEDYSQEDEAASQSEEKTGFGHKVKSRK